MTDQLSRRNSQVVGLIAVVSAIFAAAVAIVADLSAIFPLFGLLGISAIFLLSVGSGLAVHGTRKITPPRSMEAFKRQRKSVRREVQGGLSLAALSLMLLIIVLLVNSLRAAAPNVGLSPAGLQTELFDDFNSGDISLNKWDIDDPKSLMTATEGVLQINAPPSLPYTSSTLTAKPPRQVISVEFQASILGTTAPSKASAYVILVGDRGQRRIAIAPYANVPNRQGFEAESCMSQGCEEVNDVGERQLAIRGEPYLMSMVANQDSTTFSVSGFAPLTGPPIGTVKEVRIYVSTDSRAPLKVNIDNVKFGYYN